MIKRIAPLLAFVLLAFCSASPVGPVGDYRALRESSPADFARGVKNCHATKTCPVPPPPDTTPPPPDTTTCCLVIVSPGQNLQSLVNANPAGTRFTLLPGFYYNQSVLPKTGNTFRCEPGAVLDGKGVTTYAFYLGLNGVPPFPNYVTIKGCEIKGYDTPTAFGPILPCWNFKTECSIGWVIDSNNVHHNSDVGIRGGRRAHVGWNWVHDNGTFGLAGPGDTMVVEGNVVTYNGDPNHVLESGGTKFATTTGLIVRNNTFSNNRAPGLWLDIANVGYLLEGNLLEDNYAESIVIEISYGGIIRYNTIRRGGLDDPRSVAWCWNGGIEISASGGTGIEIYGNLLEGNAYGISLIQQGRGTNHPGEPTGIDPEMLVQNVNIHDNKIVAQTVPGHLTNSRGGIVGCDDTGAAAGAGLYDKVTRGNTSNYNTFVLNGLSFPWAFDNGFRNTAYWIGSRSCTGTCTGAAFDINSVITP